MKVNMGAVDSVLRLAAGIGAISAGIYYSNWFGLLGVLPLITGGTRRCPIYYPFHFDTRKNKDKS